MGLGLAFCSVRACSARTLEAAVGFTVNGARADRDRPPPCGGLSCAEACPRRRAARAEAGAAAAAGVSARASGCSSGFQSKLSLCLVIWSLTDAYLGAHAGLGLGLGLGRQAGHTRVGLRRIGRLLSGGAGCTLGSA